jgi:hypothetical protein
MNGNARVHMSLTPLPKFGTWTLADLPAARMAGKSNRAKQTQRFSARLGSTEIHADLSLDQKIKSYLPAIARV